MHPTHRSHASFSHPFVSVLHARWGAIFTPQIHLQRAAFLILQLDIIIQQAVCVERAVRYSAVRAAWQRLSEETVKRLYSNWRHHQGAVYRIQSRTV